MKPADYFYQYMHGFHAAAGCKTIDKARSEHADKSMRTAYFDGWNCGKAFSKLAVRRAVELYGYEPSVIRPAELSDPERAPECK